MSMPKKSQDNEVKEGQEVGLPKASLTQYFMPIDQSQPGAQAILDQVNGLIAQWTDRGYGIKTAFPVSNVQLTLPGSMLKGISVCILFTRE
jgi:hypothetical protein